MGSTLLWCRLAAAGTVQGDLPHASPDNGGLGLVDRPTREICFAFKLDRVTVFAFGVVQNPSGCIAPGNVLYISGLDKTTEKD